MSTATVVTGAGRRCWRRPSSRWLVRAFGRTSATGRSTTAHEADRPAGRDELGSPPPSTTDSSTRRSGIAWAACIRPTACCGRSTSRSWRTCSGPAGGTRRASCWWPRPRRWSNTGTAEDGPYGAGPDAAQLAVDAAVAPRRVLPGQPQHQRLDLRRHCGAAAAVWIGPAAPNQVAMPSQQRGRLDEQAVPDRAWQHPRKPSQHRAVGPVEPGSGYLLAEYRDLVPQHQQLRVLGR
jgi:hypothetical protein